MDTYRINRYDIANQSSYTNRLVQCGLRYQKLNLSSAGELELSGVGLKPSLSHTSLATIPGSFSCSDHVLNNIWNTGARTIQLNELPAHSVLDFWVITDQGAFVDSLAPQPFAADYAAMLTSYDLGFSVKPISNGFGFTVLSDTLGKGVYIFVNVANSSISAHAGSTELDTPLASGPLPPSIKLNEWHTVYSVVNATHISVQIDGFSVLQFSQTSSSGSFWFGRILGSHGLFLPTFPSTPLEIRGIFLPLLTKPPWKAFCLEQILYPSASTAPDVIVPRTQEILILLPAALLPALVGFNI